MKPQPLHYTDRTEILDHCGIIAAYSQIPTAFFTRGLAGLLKIQTRGYDGVGVLSMDKAGKYQQHLGEGTIEEAFSMKAVRKFSKIEAPIWMFQIRYGTAGNSDKKNLQPIVRVHQESKTTFAVVHNGQFSDSTDTLEKIASDTVQFADRLSRIKGKNWDDRIVKMIRTTTGAWSMAIATPSALYIIRDPRGVRPLCYGSIGKLYVATSEASALEAMGIQEYKEVMPGEILKCSARGVKQIFQRDTSQIGGACIFENIYIQSGGTPVHAIRKNPTQIQKAITTTMFRRRCGAILALEDMVGFGDRVDLAIGIPGTGIPGGESYAITLGIPYMQAVRDRTPQDTRTFMTPNITQIPDKIANHFVFDEHLIAGKRVVLVDDSLVRGNIMKGLVKMVKEGYGAKEVHIRILCPPIDKPCHLGLNTRAAKELIAYILDGDVEKIRAEIGADSLRYLSDTGLLKAAGTGSGFCMGCMVKHHPPIDRTGKTPSEYKPLSIMN